MCSQVGFDPGQQSSAEVSSPEPEEFKYQVQREESGVFGLYIEMIESFCGMVLKEFADHELELLWLDCDMYFDHDAEDGTPSRRLKFDPDEEYQVATFEEDLAPYRATPDEHSD